jgi:hypothetical protein
MVRAVTAAACGQAGIVASVERDREWAKPKEQHEQDRQRAPHIGLMLHKATR